MIDIYTDGACKGNPGVGGWGALIVDGSLKREIYGGELVTTNNKMELKAVIMALKELTSGDIVNVYTDSTYVLKGIEEWIINWKKNGWKSSNKKPVKNKDLWIELDQMTSLFKLKWFWIKGHSGHPGNERADLLANKGVSSAMEQV
ncbi:MAG: ribonuclease HI [Methylophilaceae bacterium]